MKLATNDTTGGIYQIVTSRIEDDEIHINDNLVEPIQELIAAILNDEPFGTSSRLNGVLFTGLFGTGKTYTASYVRTVVSDKLGQEISMFVVGGISSPADVTKLYADAREAAKKFGRCIIFDDEVEKHGKRGELQDPIREAILDQFFMEINGAANDNRGVITISATNRPNDIDPAYRRGKRVSKTLQFDPLNRRGRDTMARIEAFVKDHQFIYDESDIAMVVERTYGAVAADISQLYVDASTYANLRLMNQMTEIAKQLHFGGVKDGELLRLCQELPLENLKIDYKGLLKHMRGSLEEWLKEFRLAQETKGYEDKASGFIAVKALEYLNPNETSGRVAQDRALLTAMSQDIRKAKDPGDEDSAVKQLEKRQPAKTPTRWIHVTTRDIEHVLETFVPSALKDMPFEETKLTFASFGGLESETRLLETLVRNTIAQEGKDGTTIYMYGPLGNGVTSLAKAVAGQYGFNLIVMYGADQESMWVGKVKDRLLEINERATASKPTVVVFDNLRYLTLDARGPDQSYKQSATSTIKQIIKPVPGVIYIATGETLEELPPDILHLFQRKMHILEPKEAKDYAKIWENHLHPDYLTEKKIDIAELSQRSVGLSGGDVYRICRMFPELGANYSQQKLDEAVGNFKQQKQSASAIDDMQITNIILG